MAANIEVRTVEPVNCQAAYAFQCEYLDRESWDEFTARIHTDPALYLAAFDSDVLVGVCYGQPSDKDDTALHLQGIAVNLDETKGYARKGIGSMMLRELETTAKKKGYAKIDVGSADDEKVERFYLRNGFEPYELVAKGPAYEEYERVSVMNYESGKATQSELRNKHDATEVIFIFSKVLDLD